MGETQSKASSTPEQQATIEKTTAVIKDPVSDKDSVSDKDGSNINMMIIIFVVIIAVIMAIIFVPFKSIFGGSVTGGLESMFGGASSTTGDGI